MLHPHRPARRFFTLAGLVLVVAVAAAASTGTAARGADPGNAGTPLTDPTPLLPPQVTVSQRSAQAAPGFVFVAPKGGAAGAQQGPEIVDDQGRPVWFHAIPNGEQATDFRVQRYRGKPVLTWWQGASHTGVGHGEGVGYIVDRSYRVIATVRAGNGLDADSHEFVLTPRGTALITIYHQVPYDLSSVGGPKDGKVFDGVVQEIDVDTGRILFEWHSLDHVAVSESHAPVPTSPAVTYDYFHINAVSLDAHGDLLIDARNTWAVYDVDRSTGEVNWRLGGTKSDFQLGPGVQFAWQHNPLAVGRDTIRLFDNEASPKVLPYSRVIWIRLDTEAKTATLVKEFRHPAGVSAGSQGNSQALDNGDTFVGWGQTGRLSEFDSQGSLLFDATVPAGYDTYRAYRESWSAEPESDPIATGQRNADGTTTVHALWNGATDVAAWRVLAGSDAKALAPVATAAWAGLDTAVTVSGTPKVVEVVALDARGRVIERSEPVAAT